MSFAEVSESQFSYRCTVFQHPLILVLIVSHLQIPDYDYLFLMLCKDTASNQQMQENRVKNLVRSPVGCRRAKDILLPGKLHAIALQYPCNWRLSSLLLQIAPIVFSFPYY